MRVFPLLDLQLAELANQNFTPIHYQRVRTTAHFIAGLAADERCKVANQNSNFDVGDRGYGKEPMT